MVDSLPVEDIPVVDKRLWDIPLVDTLVEEEHQQGVVADCSNSFFVDGFCNLNSFDSTKSFEKSGYFYIWVFFYN